MTLKVQECNQNVSSDSSISIGGKGIFLTGDTQGFLSQKWYTNICMRIVHIHELYICYDVSTSFTP